ncbi:hypothetical protein M0638_07245 [Roseomonas sp. NAR14]|uniref:Uncharacterized protein n=1 Tax=Roseomonas acroporae TaxID=2937791 RepID=A0A9X2BWR3_9PROT|nr:hypothetical protein [Roseomonas acroporae]MCK8784170.1 hypothetical protein [Roseomonas acroporae]
MSPIPVTLLPDGRAVHGEHEAKGRTPILALARVLVAAGFDPGRPVEVSGADGRPGLRGRLGAMARLTVTEGDREGPRFALWQPMPADRLAELREIGRPAATAAAH